MGFRIFGVEQGMQFGRWTVIDIRSSHGNCATCRCDCGSVARVDRRALRIGSTTCCVLCRNKKMVIHGEHNSPEYRSWRHAKQRCFNQSDPAFNHYGGRGIVMCEAWRNDFREFLRDMGRRPQTGLTLERIDVNRGYEPGNCRWATQLEQCNNRRITLRLSFKGVTKSLADWAREVGMTRDCLHSRIEKWGDIERALTTPVQQRSVVR